MAPTAFERDCHAILPASRCRPGVPLAPLTTFKVGGAADWLIDVKDEAELIGVLAAARRTGMPVTVMGGGSNVLVADAGVRGAVVRLGLRSVERVAPGRVRAGAGLTMNGLVRWTISHGLAGLEAWAGTPGTVGGAIHGNAHFQGQDIGGLVATVGLVARDGGVVTATPQAEMAFAYDSSRLQRTREIVVWVEFKVEPGDPDVLRTRARASLAYRKKTQPLALASAGCVFQNPDPRLDPVPDGIPPSAGALVDRAGLKGHAVGGARISETHANFIVNDAGARASDVRALIELARRRVQEAFGVALRDEIVFLGEWE